jgi:hypothetical protein
MYEESVRRWALSQGTRFIPEDIAIRSNSCEMQLLRLILKEILLHPQYCSASSDSYAMGKR